MKVGDKYIIEIEEVIRRNGAPQIARIKGFNTLVFDKYGLEKLEPYIWEKTYIHGYRDGKKAAMNESEMITSKDIADAYKKGLNDAWEAAKKIALMDTETSENVTGYFGLFNIMGKLTPMQAIEKLKTYEDKQKQDAEDAEIKVGDEIVCMDAHVVVTYISPKGEWNGFLLNEGNHGKKGQGYTCMSSFKGWRKTGRHFPQIAKVLSAW